MFSSIGWGEILILIAAALIILGPERLPGAITWTMQSVRKMRDYATGASEDLQKQMGTDFDALREPLAQLNELRQMTPKALVTKHLFDGDGSTLDSLETSVRDSLSITGTAPATPHPAPSAAEVDRLEKAAAASFGDGGATRVDPSRLNGDVVAPPTASDPARKRDVVDWDAT